MVDGPTDRLRNAMAEEYIARLDKAARARRPDLIIALMVLACLLWLAIAL